MDDIVSWIESWREKYFDRNWETENGLEISTVSNPGWVVKIDLCGTSVEHITYDSGLVENSSEYIDDATSTIFTRHDWYNISVKGGVFKGSGDNRKLKFILSEFKRLCIEHGEDL